MYNEREGGTGKDKERERETAGNADRAVNNEANPKRIGADAPTGYNW